VVINAKRKAIGVFSEGDVLRAILEGVDIHTPLTNIIRPSFKYLLARDAAGERHLFLTGITLVPILTKNFTVKEVLTLNDVFGA
jgi:CBS domain-containing protein